MKLLRNPVVTGLLAVVAVVVVYIQVVAPNVKCGGRPSPAPVAVTPPPAPPGQAAPAAPSQVLSQQTPKVTARVRPDEPMDRRFAEVHFDGWVNWPRRDPFFLMSPDPPDPQANVTVTNSPVTSWKLHLIYVQDGARVAAINRGVYREGDEVQPGYKVIKIEVDEVWFQGPGRKERLGFDRKLPAVP